MQSGGLRLRVDLRGSGGGESTVGSTIGIEEESERSVVPSLCAVELGALGSGSSSSGGLGIIGCSSDCMSSLRL